MTILFTDFEMAFTSSPHFLYFPHFLDRKELNSSPLPSLSQDTHTWARLPTLVCNSTLPTCTLSHSSNNTDLSLPHPFTVSISSPHLPISLLLFRLSFIKKRRHLPLLPSTRFSPSTLTRCQNESEEKETGDSKKVRKRGHDVIIHEARHIFVRYKDSLLLKDFCPL